MRKPKVWLQHSTTRQWQQLEGVTFVQCEGCADDPRHVLIHFKNHWHNRNVIMQLRRAIDTAWARGGKKFKITFFPKKGESLTVELTARITFVKERQGKAEVAAVASSEGITIVGET